MGTDWDLGQRVVADAKGNMALDQVLCRLNGVRQTRNGWKALCPAHEDRTPSLSITQADGRILLHCFAGCPTERIVAALGLTMADLFDGSDSCEPPQVSRSRSISGRGDQGAGSADPLTWLADYCGVPRDFLRTLPVSVENGHIAYEFDGGVRKLRSPGRRDFHWEPSDFPNPPLWPLPDGNLPEKVWLTEGETDGILARFIGLPAYATTKGAETPLTPEQGQALRQRGVRSVNILFDVDSAGRNGARKMAEVLTSAGLEAQIVDLAASGIVDPLRGGKDLRDIWLASRDRETLRRCLEEAEFLSATYRIDVVAERNLPFRTAHEIAESTPAEVNWIAKPWVAAGAITELAGPIKLGGKTTFALHLVRAVLDGQSFLGESIERGPVVYLTEQTGPSLRQALARADLLDRDDMLILRWHDTLGVPWPEVVEASVNEARQRGAKLLVVDTLGQFARLRGDAENNAGAAQEALEPLQRAAGVGLGVLGVRHERKGGGEVGEASRGSSAFGGGVDIIISIRRAQGDRPTIRSLRALSRFHQTPDSLMIDLTPNGYVPLGSHAAFALEEAEEAILDVVPALEEAALPLEELLERAEIKRSTAQKGIAKLIDSGQLRRTGKGKRNDPYRFYAAYPDEIEF